MPEARMLIFSYYLEIEKIHKLMELVPKLIIVPLRIVPFTFFLYTVKRPRKFIMLHEENSVVIFRNIFNKFN